MKTREPKQMCIFFLATLCVVQSGVAFTLGPDSEGNSSQRNRPQTDTPVDILLRPESAHDDQSLQVSSQELNFASLQIQSLMAQNQHLLEMSNQTCSRNIEKAMEELEQKLTDKINNATDYIITVIRNTPEKQNETVTPDSEVVIWPDGTYGLMATENGCPDDGFTSWHEGSRKHHTEDENNADQVTSPNHFRKPVTSTHGYKHFVTQHFCIKTQIGLGGPWPKGSYCINKKSDCPPGFGEGYIKWDEEDDGADHSESSGTLPDGDFRSDAVIRYCCRLDGPAGLPIRLPTSSDFYLYSKGNRCQLVAHMAVSEETMTFDTEDDNNVDEMGGNHPDASIDKITLRLCYYKSNLP